MFFFKKKKIIVDAFTTIPWIEKLYPVSTSVNFYPTWWKSIPKQYKSSNDYGIEFDVDTIRRCDGLIDYYKSGIVIPLWSDLAIKTQESGGFAFTFSDIDTRNPSSIISHDRMQYGPTFDDWIHMKISTPWKFREKTGVNFFYTAACWNQVPLWQDIYIVDAVVNYKFQHSTNINFFTPRKDNDIRLQAGQPMAMIVPLTDHDIDVKTHVVDEREYMKYMSPLNKFNGCYKEIKKIMSNQKKCPFGFGK